MDESLSEPTPLNSEPGVSDFLRDPPQELLQALNTQLPDSLPLLRRLQFVSRGGSSEHTHVLLARSNSKDVEDSGRGVEFAAAYLDLSRGPETEMWIYCSSERGSTMKVTEKVTSSTDYHAECDTRAQLARECLLALMRRVKYILTENPLPRPHAGTLLIGAVAERTRVLILEYAGVEVVRESFWDRWDFRVSDVRESVGMELPNGFRWDRVTRKDAEVAVSRTNIKRTVDTMMMLPSLTIKTEDTGELVAWGFLGPDGSLNALHCEPHYRGRGLAKMLAAKLHREQLGFYGGAQDGICRADVDADNMPSQNVVKSLGGKKVAVVWWGRIKFV